MPNIEWAESPWYSRGWWRPPTNIVLHSAATTLAGLLATFGPNSTRRVSAHFTVDGASGRIIQHVALEDRAWHALDTNDFAVGIETIDGGPWGTHPEWTYELTAWLVREVVAPHFSLSINDDVVGPHSRWVATACPANLDWPRIIEEAGGSMPEYVSRQEYEAHQTDVRDSFESVKNALHKHTHGGAVIPSTLPIRLPAGPRKRTAASARKGHGRGKSRDVKE